MINEKHREAAIKAFDTYLSGNCTSAIYKISDLEPGKLIDFPLWRNCVYVLRLQANLSHSPSIAAIPNLNDPNKILYIGGHESGKITGRFNSLIDSCINVERTYEQSGKSENDRQHRHPVASCLTTSLLGEGFSINKCEIELIESGEWFDELEILIGYHEMYHHLPPWNTMRKGRMGYKVCE